MELQQQDATGTPSISASTFAPQSELAVDVSSVRDVNGLGTYEYTWQFYHAGRGDWNTFREDANPIYTIPTSAWDTNRISVRAAITHTDLFGDITGLGRVAIGIPRDPQGEPQVAIVDNAQVAVGVTASVNVSGISDANSRAGPGRGSYAYQWLEPNNAVKTGQTRNIYILNQTDVRNIAATTPPKVRVTYTDELGFEFSWTVRVEVVRVEIGLQGDLVTSQVIDPNAIAVPSSYTYQWQEGDALDGQYRNIVGSNSSTYRLPQIVPPSHPFVRLSVSYARRSDQQRAPAVSRGLQVAGINRASSTLGLLGDGVAAGAVYRPDLSELRDVVGRVPNPSQLTYEWRAGDGANYTPIPNAEAYTYTLSPDDFDESNNYLQLRVADSTGLGGDFFAAINLQRESTGNPEVRGGELYENAVFEADVASVADENGLGEFRNQWYRITDDGNQVLLTVQTGINYTLNSLDFKGFKGAGNHQLAVVVVHHDAFGFRTTFPLAKFNLQRPQVSGGLAVVPECASCFGPAAVFNLQNNINYPGGGGILSNLQWSRSSSATPNFVDIGGATTLLYTLASPWNANSNDNFDLLRVAATFQDPFGQTTLLISDPILLNRPVTGEAQIMDAAGNLIYRAREDDVVSVNLSNLRDANNTNRRFTAAPTISYQWFAGTTNVGTTPSYTVSADDVRRAAGGSFVRVEIVLQDDLGFKNTITSGFVAAAAIASEQTRQVAAVLNVAAAREVMDVVRDHLDRSAETSSGRRARFHLNEVELSDNTQVSRALSSRTEDSLNSGRNFAVDSFGAQVGGGESQWSAWVYGRQYSLEGKPVLSGQVYEYAGKSSGIYVGADVRFDAWRLGLAAGSSNADLDVALNADGARDDKVEREVQSILPYVEYSGERGRLRIVGGVGRGDMLVSEGGVGGCQGNIDMAWFFAGGSGDYRLLMLDSWDLSAKGGINNSRSELTDSRCSNVPLNLPGSESRSGEGVLGLRLDYRGGSNFRPYVSVDGRKMFGDIADKVVYDVGSGFDLKMGGWKLRLSGAAQVSQATHRRNSLGGSISYYSGIFQSSLGSNIEKTDNERIGVVHRWEIKHNSEWGLNTINSGFYVERRRADSTNKPHDSIGANLSVDL